MCKGLCTAIGMIGNNICEKLGDDLLIGNEHTRRISPDCESPSKTMRVETFDTTDDEKVEIVLNDPKFGMFSLFKYHKRIFSFKVSLVYFYSAFLKLLSKLSFSEIY